MGSMRTTIRLDDEVLREAKAHAARSGRTLTALIEDALRQRLAESRDGSAVEPYRVATFRSSLRPGVDLDDNEALADVLDGP